MNKEYTYIDGKVIISDENGNKTQDKYYDKIEEVLIQENLIETMENKMQVLEDESESYKKYNRKHYIPFTPITVLITVIGVYLLLNNSPYNPIDTIFGPMNQALAIGTVFSICATSIGAYAEYILYSNYKYHIKREKGIDSKLEYLKKQLEEEKEKLNELKKDKTNSNENNEFRTVLVDDTQKLEKLIDDLNFHFELGYNSDKYYKYYQKGKIDEKLKNYTADEIEIAKEYLEEKGSTLVKKRKRLLKNRKD